MQLRSIRRSWFSLLQATIVVLGCVGMGKVDARAQEPGSSDWAAIRDAFQPPEQWRDKFGNYRSPLLFNDGRIATSEVDWKLRRSELLSDWHALLGTWPALITEPKLEVLEEQRRENFRQLKVRFLWTPTELATGYLLIPDGEGKRPAVLTVYYEPETSIGLDKELRDFGLQLARRGFVVLSIGTTEATEAKIGRASCRERVSSKV